MAQRVMVYIIARMLEIDNAGAGNAVDDWWVDVTDEGSAKVNAIKEARNAATPGNRTVLERYHVYYADGGHGRFKQREYLIEEAALWPSNPSLRPVPLLPTPELLPA